VTPVGGAEMSQVTGETLLNSSQEYSLAGGKDIRIIERGAGGGRRTHRTLKKRETYVSASIGQ